jgi:hypothetical protein
MVTANTVEHGLTEIVGDRHAVISTTKSDNNSPQNVAFEIDPTRRAESHELSQRRQTRKDKEHESRQQQEKKLIRAYRETKTFDRNDTSSMDYHKLRQVVTLRHKLWAATKAKATARRLFLSAPVHDPEELQKLEQRPASLFLLVTAAEETRLRKGEAPFQPDMRNMQPFPEVYKDYLATMRPPIT